MFHFCCADYCSYNNPSSNSRPPRLTSSGCVFRGLRKSQAPKIVGRGLRLVACGEKGAAISLQEPNPRLDITGVSQIAVDRELGAQEGCAQFGDQFLCRIGALAKAVAQVTSRRELCPVQ